MGFFGFPGETREEAWSSVQFLEQNKDYVHSLGSARSTWDGTIRVAKHPEKFGVTAYKNPGVGSGAGLLLHGEAGLEH